MNIMSCIAHVRRNDGRQGPRCLTSQSLPPLLRFPRRPFPCPLPFSPDPRYNKITYGGPLDTTSILLVSWLGHQLGFHFLIVSRRGNPARLEGWRICVFGYDMDLCHVCSRNVEGQGV